jgi:hypothetical protein
MRAKRPHSILAMLLAATALLPPLTGAYVAANAATSFEDPFTGDDSAHYETEGGKWAFDPSRHGLTMAKATESNNEGMWALRRDVTLPRAFTLEADYTADGNDTSAALALKNPDTGDYACATLSLKKDDAGGWWVTAWIVYSYPDEKWAYLQQSKQHVAGLADPTFRLQLTRSPGSNALEFLVANSDLGTLETSLSVETVGEDGRKLSGAWPDTLNSLSCVGVYGYDSGGTWANIRLTDLSK